jgi:hypothetical protein
MVKRSQPNHQVAQRILHLLLASVECRSACKLLYFDFAKPNIPVLGTHMEELVGKGASRLPGVALNVLQLFFVLTDRWWATGASEFELMTRDEMCRAISCLHHDFRVPNAANSAIALLQLFAGHARAVEDAPWRPKLTAEREKLNAFFTLV